MQYLKIDKGGKVFGIVAPIQCLILSHCFVASGVPIFSEYNEPLDGFGT